MEEAVVSQSKAMSQYLLEEPEESHKNVIEDRICGFELRIF
jgi:hypothetical protein